MKHTLLIVDDDTLILNTLREKFSSWDIDLFDAESSAKACELLEKITPDVLLLDLLLTKGDGSAEILDYIKSQERLQNVCVIVLTNLEKPELKEIMLGQGVKEYWIKGNMSLDELFEKVSGYLEPKKH